MDREKRSLLLVDSSPTYLFYTGMLLKRLEYTVHTSTSPDAALQTMEELIPSLIITDTLFPNRDGISLIKQIKQDARLKSVPVIVHTSESNPALKETCLSSGCADYFRKPADPDMLFQAIQSAIEMQPRQNIRIETYLRVEVGGDMTSGSAPRTEYVIALSEGGLYIKTSTPEPVHSIIPLRIFVGNREVRVKATVQYISMMVGGQHKEPGMGMKFADISREDKEFFKNFIKEKVTRGIFL